MITRPRTIWLSLAVGLSTLIAQNSSSHYSLPAGQQFTNAGRQLLTISPDGEKFVYVANNRLYVKDAPDKNGKGGENARPITDASAGVTNPIFSPDGKFIAFWNQSDQSLKRVSIDGGTPQIICQSDNPFGMSWTADDQIVFGQGPNGILRDNRNLRSPARNRFACPVSFSLPEPFEDSTTSLPTVSSF